MHFDRRSLIVGTLAVVATGCGGNRRTPTPTNGVEATIADTLNAAVPDQELQVVRRFPTTALTPGLIRLPISLGDKEGIASSGPSRLSGRILNEAGDVVVNDLAAPMRGKGLSNPHWTFVATVPDVGVYTLQVDGANSQGAAFQLNDASTVRVPQIGQALPPFDTPTLDNPAGVDPVCTRDPECGFHSVSLTDALTQAKPIVYLIGTPAYCKTGVCGPMLDFLLAARQRVGDAATFIHTEIYTDETLRNVAPAVTAYALDYEPVIFIADASGVIVHRLDAIADGDEIDEAIAAVV